MLAVSSWFVHGKYELHAEHKAAESADSSHFGVIFPSKAKTRGAKRLSGPCRGVYSAVTPRSREPGSLALITKLER